MQVSTNDIPWLMKHGKEIGKAAVAGDKKAQKIIHWYSTSRRIGDLFGISYAEEMAKEWVAENAS